MEVYIIRHGETVWNAAGKMQGNADIELNESGRELAGELGRRLEEVHFDRIYSSPLIRAYETACLIRGHRNIPIIRDDRLREICFGTLEGTHYSEWMREDNPYRFFFNEPARYTPPEGGETLEQVCARAKDFLQQVVEPAWATTERIMIVAHGALNKGLMCYIEDHGTDTFWGEALQQNCEASIFTYDGTTWK
ncbi:MAG: histidine phosphatase family protein [Acetatifactor sp.]|nr:histidine phosphatase family protein [Acetatifactor sp.]